jgi:hypothetical protein
MRKIKRRFLFIISPIALDFLILDVVHLGLRPM